ncbi:CocE/NonD family hydrolase [Nonomuraea soli]|uniref:X-Pro dipeptidyl-peptidase n=1 Tax=Nonomuraea soli TaxID=1032476 RepID=A0A7W0CQ43_9ACTN|nr:CocE/NonD family hydrolase [Nonomuraea soli]MBA2895025.1 X-Pro dipeptidyl-peptidase [Nonomuraea soli]
MTIPHRLAAVPLATVIAVAGVPAAPATARAGTRPVHSYADAIREHVRVESPVDSDGDGRKDQVRVDIIRPRTGSRVPVIMHQSPYFDTPGVGFQLDRKTYGADGNLTKFPLFYDNYFVPRGYAFISVDMIGTRLSDGCPTGGGPSDVAGGKAVIDWLNGRATAYDAQGRPVRADWTTGRTAMIGHSYEGGLAMGVAGTGVRGLETIVPLAGPSSWYDMWRLNGTITDFRGGQAFMAKLIDADPEGKCAAVRQGMTEASDDATGDYNGYWRELDYRLTARNVRASVFSVVGLHDRNVMGNQFSTWWEQLPGTVERKVWVTQYGHLDPFWARREAWVATLHRWFDHELMGIDNGITREPRADVQLGPGRWITQADWPAPARSVTLRPQADGSLAPARSKGRGGYLDTGQSELAMAGSPGTADPNRLAYLTPPLEEPVRLSGTPRVSLKVTLDKPTANLGVLLVDYGVDTRIHGVDPAQAQGLKLVEGQDCVGESTDDDSSCYVRAADNTITSAYQVVSRGLIDAQNRRSLSRSAPLTPGRPYQVTWDLLPQDYEFKAGHRLGLVLTGTNADLAQPALGSGESATGARVSVDLAGTSITLPLVITH